MLHSAKDALSLILLSLSVSVSLLLLLVAEAEPVAESFGTASGSANSANRGREESLLGQGGEV